MLRLCDNSVVLPLKIINQNILNESIYPNIWKLADATPLHKKEDKQQVKNYRPISLYVETSLKDLFSIIFTTTAM